MKRPPLGALAAIAWAVSAMPPASEPGEWLARILPEGSWDEIDGEVLADQMVGAAVRAQREPVPQ